MVGTAGIRFSSSFVSCGVNRVVNALDWGDNGLIAYCGHRIVCIYDPEAAEVIGTLTGHTGQVNCVKWLPSSVTGCGSAVLLSGAADNSIRVWAWHGRQHSPPYTCLTQLQGHDSAVTSLALQILSQDQLLLASTSADPHIRLWHCNLSTSPAGAFEHTQRQQLQDSSSSSLQEQLTVLQQRFGSCAWQQQPVVHVGRQIQHCVALATLPEDPSCVLMASGGTDSTVRLYVRDPSSSSSSCNIMAAAADLRPQKQGCAGISAAVPSFQLQCQLKGHENWVKGVAFQKVRESSAQPGQQGAVSLLLASAGQDRYGRIWCISTDPNRSNAAADGAAGISSSGAGDDALRKLITRYAPRPHLTAGSHTYWVTLEALLIGHEDWLHSVGWRPNPAAAANGTPTAAGVNGCVSSSSLDAARIPGRSDLTLLTTSQDRSMMLWGFDVPNELWISDAAIGDAGASCLGFYGGAFNPSGDQLVAHGFTGALHLWKQQSDAGSSGSSERWLWVPQHALGGHYGAVQDLAWGADGACLQSVATDQTARLFSGIKGHWFELARTQVHGHDFSCLATIPTPSSSSTTTITTTTTTTTTAAAAATTDSSSSQQQPLPPACVMYVSGSEEKVLRVFEAPQAFIESVTAVRALQSSEAAAASGAALAAASASSSGASDGAVAAGRGRALGASIAALGLSNKAVYVEEDPESAGLGNGDAGGEGGSMGGDPYMAEYTPAVPTVLSGPPLEEHLAQNTLWPEIRKLYGHGNDVFCVSASPSGRVIASACKAQSAGAAAVWVWEVGSWKSLAQLSGHTLTVTQLEFSPDGSYLLSGSRDRSFSVWKVPEQYRLGGPGSAAAAATGGSAVVEFELLGRSKAAHSRIIWSVSWAHDGSLFATGSRDQTVKVWSLAGVGAQQQKPIAVLPPFPAGVTAVALSPQHVSAAAAAGQQTSPADSVHLLAVGTEDGQLQVWRLQMQGSNPGGHNSLSEGQQGPGQQQQVVFERLWCSEVWQQHAAAVRRLRWAPGCVAQLCGEGSTVALASCGEDHSVRLYDVAL